MLSHLQQLGIETDGRYATDAELVVFVQYARSFALRATTYRQLQALERTIVEQVYARMQLRSPELFVRAGEDVSAKWRRDTVRVLRYTAITVLLNDPDSLRERLLFWMRTVMKAFNAEESCNVTYHIMQEVVKQKLPAQQADLVCAILELNRQILGQV